MANQRLVLAFVLVGATLTSARPSLINADVLGTGPSNNGGLLSANVLGQPNGISVNVGGVGGVPSNLADVNVLGYKNNDPYAQPAYQPQQNSLVDVNALGYKNVDPYGKPIDPAYQPQNSLADVNVLANKPVDRSGLANVNVLTAPNGSPNLPSYNQVPQNNPSPVSGYNPQYNPSPVSGYNPQVPQYTPQVSGYTPY